MDDVLGDVQFLANSANRIRVLEALRDGPASRRELQEETGVPRSTAARVLDDAEARGWVDSRGSQYRITPVGEVTVSEFRAYVKTMQGIRHLGRRSTGFRNPLSNSISGTSETPTWRRRPRGIRPRRSTGDSTASGPQIDIADSRRTPCPSTWT